MQLNPPQNLTDLPLTQFHHEQGLGIYVHVPFCVQRCRYCAFVSSVIKSIPGREYARAVIREFELRKGECADRRVMTIYFGGGTPSILDDDDLEEMLSHFLGIGSQPPEVTLEANPNHVLPERAKRWRSMGITRVSLGLQSLDDTKLRWLGRRHTANRGRQAVETLKNCGFDDISVDLIYGGMDDEEKSSEIALKDWENELIQVHSLSPSHVSCYELTIEEHTPLWTAQKRGQKILYSEECILEMMRMIPKVLGMQRYEISNYSRDGYYSSHNLSCWTGIPYLGLGPGAHSMTRRSDAVYRRANGPAVLPWIRGLLDENRLPEVLFEERILPQMHLAERLMCAARTLLIWKPGEIADQIRADVSPYLAGIEQAIGEGLLKRLENGYLQTTALGVELNNRLDTLIFEGAPC